MKLRAETLRDLGAALAPFNAFLFLQGSRRCRCGWSAHVANATAVARFLERTPARRARPLSRACRQPATARWSKSTCRAAPARCSVSTCRAAATAGQRRFIEALTLLSHLANVGDAKSLVIHPASTTHRQLSDAELAAAGVGPGTIRLSVGIEDARRSDRGTCSSGLAGRRRSR